MNRGAVVVVLAGAASFACAKRPDPQRVIDVRAVAFTREPEPAIDLPVSELDGPYPDVASYCAEHTALVAPEIAEREDAGAYDPKRQSDPVELIAKPSPKRCEIAEWPLEGGAGPSLTAVFRLTIDDPDETRTRLLLHTGRGVFIGEAIEHASYLGGGDPEQCISFEGDTAYAKGRIGGDVVVLTIQRTSHRHTCDQNAIWGRPGEEPLAGPSDDYQADAVVVFCRLSALDRPACGSGKVDLPQSDPSLPPTDLDPKITVTPVAPSSRTSFASGPDRILHFGRRVGIGGRDLFGALRPKVTR